MDFQNVLDRLLEDFSKENVRWALTGGFAMGALGAPRATADLDFIVHRDDMPRVDALLGRLGYRRSVLLGTFSGNFDPVSRHGQGPRDVASRIRSVLGKSE